MSPEVSPEYAEFRRQRILEAAWHSFAENGVRGTTMRGIAERLGLSTGVLYAYFENKHEIIVALEEMATQQNRVLLADLEEKATAREALKWLFDFPLRCCDPESFRLSAQSNLTSWSEALRTPAFEEGFARSRQRLGESLASIIRRGIEQGELSPKLSPDAAVDAILATYFGVYVQAALVEDLNTPMLLRTARELIMEGLPWRD